MAKQVALLSTLLVSVQVPELLMLVQMAISACAVNVGVEEVSFRVSCMLVFLAGARDALSFGCRSD